MTKTQLLDRLGGDADQRFLLARLLDQHQFAQTRGLPASSGFLSPGEQALAQRLLAQLPPSSHAFLGGYPEAERRVCTFLPARMCAEDIESPLRALAVTVPPMAALRHRDYLGALMGLGLRREKLGDILLTDTGCQLVVLEEALPILLDQFLAVGRAPLRLAPIPLTALRALPSETKTLRNTVASLRLDAVAAAVFSFSRAEAARRIASGRISLNHLPCDQPDRPVAPGDSLSCRGLGKCVLRQVGGKSRKGRTVIEWERFV